MTYDEANELVATLNDGTGDLDRIAFTIANRCDGHSLKRDTDGTWILVPWTIDPNRPSIRITI